MPTETRLETLKRYRTEAMLDPKANKLYIDDLNLSIDMEANKPEYGAIVMHGFKLND